MTTLRLAGKARLLVLPATLLLALAACDSSASGRGRARTEEAHQSTLLPQDMSGGDEDDTTEEQQAAAQNCGPAPAPNSATPTFLVSHGGSGPGHFGSLGCALQAAISYSQPSVQKVTVLVAPGTYSGEEIALALRPNIPVIVVAPQGNRRPVFQGNGTGTWLSAKGAVGARTPISITGMEIRNYETAITLNARRSPDAPWIGGFTVTNSHFDTIGQFSPDQKFSTAAIRFVNSSYNDFENNVFTNVRDLSACGHLHAFYMAHYSSHNAVRNNFFDNECGTPIKVRDRSDDNQIIGNKFSHQQATSLFIDAFCNPRKGKRCTANHAECPSQNNVFSGNTYLVDADERAPSAVDVRWTQPLPGCESTNSDPAARVRESGTQFVPRG